MALAGPELEGYRRIGGGGAGACWDTLPRVLEVEGNGLLASCGLSKLGEGLGPSPELRFERGPELLGDDYRRKIQKVRKE